MRGRDPIGNAAKPAKRSRPPVDARASETRSTLGHHAVAVRTRAAHGVGLALSTVVAATT